MQEANATIRDQTPKGNQLLIIDDERPICDLIADVAEAYSYNAYTATSYAEAQAILETVSPNLKKASRYS